MPTFEYEAMNQAGQEVKDRIEAASTEDALALIRSKGFYPTKLRQKGGKKAAAAGKGGGGAPGAKKKKSAGGFGKVKTKEITQFTRQLSTLQDAGLPILRLHSRTAAKPGMLQVIIEPSPTTLRWGHVVEAMAHHPKAFDAFTATWWPRADRRCARRNPPASGRLLEGPQNESRRGHDLPHRGHHLRRLIVAGIMIVVVPKFRNL